MKILLMFSVYDRHLADFYRRHPPSGEICYREQQRALLSDLSGWANRLVEPLNALGHEADIIIPNALPLQAAWAREHGIEITENWSFDIPAKQIQAANPDVLWISSMFQYYGRFLREVSGHCRHTVSWIACPIPPRLDLAPVDAVLTSHTNYVRLFREAGKVSDRLLPAFDPHLLDQLGEVAVDVPLSFVGSFTADHRRRMRILCSLASKTPLNVWGYGLVDKPPPPDPRHPRRFLRQLQMWRVSRPLKRCYRGEVWGLEMLRTLKRSRATINVHIDATGDVAGNIRLFEAAGVGTLLLTEDYQDLKEILEPEREVVAYASAPELYEKVTYYLEHERERQEIATAGQRRMLADHSPAKRAAELVERLQCLLG